MSCQQFEFILNHTREFLTLINRSYNYEMVNASYAQAMGKRKEDVVGRSVAEIWGQERFESSIRPHLDTCFSGSKVGYIEKFEFGSENRYMQVEFIPYTGPEGSVTHALVSSHDITHLGELEEMLMQYEYRDPTTGLFNRKSLEILLEVELVKAQRSSPVEPRALLFIGIENLQKVNRRYGYDIGDLILENTGTRVKEAVRQSDHVFRFHGNELVVILSPLGGGNDVIKVASKILQMVVTPYRIRGTDIILSCRAGAAVYPEDGSTPEELIKSAADALADAVRDNQEFRRFDRTSRQRSSRRLSIESELRHAFEREQFELYYQPIMGASGGVDGAEALIRWSSPERGIVSPAEFLPIAAEIGMMEAISRWAIFSAARQLDRVRSRYPVYLSVNLTAKDFESNDLDNILASALAQLKGRVTPDNLKLEITESDAMYRADKAIARMHSLKEQGFDVFIDDFGTGHSSLAYLHNLPVSTVKIDKIFVDSLSGMSEDGPFVRYIIELLALKSKRIIAEGVESNEQAETLRGMGCHSFQGYFFARPMPAPEFEHFLATSWKGRTPTG